MEKRVLLAVVLSFLVLYGFQVMFPAPEAPTPGTPAGQPGATGKPAATPSAASQTPSPAPAAAPQAPAGPAPLVADAAERDIVIENPSVRAVFSTRGAVLKSWRLKKYMDPSNQPLELVPQPGDFSTGTVQAIVPGPFTLVLEDATVTNTLKNALFRPSADTITVGAAPTTLTFEYRDAAGLSATKRFDFHPQSPYVVHVTASVTQGDKAVVPAIEWGPSLGTGLDVNAGYYAMPPRAIVHQAGDEERYDADELAEIPTQGTYDFVGVDDHYFMAAAIRLNQPVQVRYEQMPIPVRPGTDKAPPPYVSWSVKFAASPNGVGFFMGPKDYDVLRSISVDLTRAIDFGIFAWLVVPLLRSLKWINVYIGNYGWSIVALTALINVLMFPLRHKSVVSMKRMQEIQPEIKAIQDRYAKLKLTDPARQKMNTEMMALYKERGVNPASGCVPMLLTLPVLFAFYAMLSVAIELRGAPFVAWIKDLSVHDPLYVTPVLMGLTQFIQTKMTPSTADPTQQRIMLLMPLMFMGMFLWAPSGLVLYWTVSNIWAIGQQAITNRIIGSGPQRTIRPPAERRLKNAGGGRSDQAAKERK